ncbi:hypothetical protein H5410_035073 [Solanum commersonii]|uniref:Uncharacterized protein n=1 Tax=Solanum commersonii TaxID=4109 RepID=A0A9J5Y077_SOLCO|nr:hypothetical protein H5410_035073 [Solanum commersonii]
MEENRDNVPTQQTSSDRNSRRCTRYAQMSPERKNLFLSQLREKRAESKRQKTLHQSNTTTAVTIAASSLPTQQVATSKPTNLPTTSTAGEHIVSCLSTFELGSTSTACDVASKLASTHTTNKGKAKNLQLYFYDNENENELTNRMTLSDNLNEFIVTKLMHMLKLNPYSTFLRSLTIIPNLSEFYIALNSTSNLDQRTYNLPTASEVGVPQTMGNNFPIASVDYTFRYIMEGLACNEEVKNISHIDSV